MGEFGWGRVFGGQATRSKEDGTNLAQEKGIAGGHLTELKALLSSFFWLCDNWLFVVTSVVEGRFPFQGGGGRQHVSRVVA